MTSEPDTALRWAAGNIGRFLLIWLLVTTAFMVTIDLADGGHLDRPHSVWAVLFLPITLAAFLAAVVITALIATILFSPVVLVWLAVYLSALCWLGRARPHALFRYSPLR